MAHLRWAKIPRWDSLIFDFFLAYPKMGQARLRVFTDKENVYHILRWAWPILRWAIMGGARLKMAQAHLGILTVLKNSILA